MDDPILEIELEDCPVCRGVGAIEDEQNWCVYVMCMDCGHRNGPCRLQDARGTADRRSAGRSPVEHRQGVHTGACD